MRPEANNNYEYHNVNKVSVQTVTAMLSSTELEF